MAGIAAINRSKYQVLTPGTFQTIDFNAASQASNAIQSELVVLFATEDCWISIDTDPTAAASATTSFRYRAGFYLTFLIERGDKVAVIRDTTNGVLDIISAGTYT